MNILIVSQYFWPENFRINDLAQELVQRGHIVTVLTGIPNYPAGAVFPEFKQNPEAFLDFEGVKILRVPMIPRGTNSARLLINYLSYVVGATLWGPAKLRGVDVDVIYVFGASPVTVALPAVLLGRIKRAPIVFWALDLWPDTLAAVGVLRSPRALNLVGHLVRFIYERCTLVLGQSHGFIESIGNYCSDKRKIRYFPSWAEEVFSADNALSAPEIPVNEERFNILFAGNIGDAQDMPAVLDAAESLKNDMRIRWLVVGDGRKSEWLRLEVDRRGLSNAVLLLGRFPLDRMPSFYAHADALLVSLKKDPVFSMTIPGKVQSYLMAGIPLIGMLDGEGAAVIRSANAGLICDAGDSAGLALAVQKMALMPAEERNKLGVNGREYAQREFGRGLLMDRLNGFLNEAVHTYKKGELM